MTFFENELRKILIPQYPETTFVGRAAYIRLSDTNRAKIQFVSTNIASHYDALRLTILNQQEGAVDNLLLRFSELLGKKMVSMGQPGGRPKRRFNKPFNRYHSAQLNGVAVKIFPRRRVLSSGV